jgi:hypothetical protein
MSRVYTLSAKHNRQPVWKKELGPANSEDIVQPTLWIAIEASVRQCRGKWIASRRLYEKAKSNKRVQRKLRAAFGGRGSSRLVRELVARVNTTQPRCRQSLPLPPLSLPPHSCSCIFDMPVKCRCNVFQISFCCAMCLDTGARCQIGTRIPKAAVFRCSGRAWRPR